MRAPSLLALAPLTLVAFVVFIVGAVAAPRPAAAWCQMTTEGGGATLDDPCVSTGLPLAWRQRCIGYALDGGGSRDLERDEVLGVLGESFDAWMQVRCDGESTGLVLEPELEPADCDRAAFSSGGGNVNTVAFVEDWEERDYDPDAFAVTIVWFSQSRGDILDADLLVNENQGPYALCPALGCRTGNPIPVDLENVLTHEAGHFLGLAHSDVRASTMFGSAIRGEVLKRTLDADDEEGLCSIYPPGTLDAACDFAPRGGLDLSCPGAGGGGGGCSRCAAAGGAPLGGLGWSALLAFLAALGLRRARHWRSRARAY